MDRAKGVPFGTLFLFARDAIEHAVELQKPANLALNSPGTRYLEL